MPAIGTQWWNFVIMSGTSTTRIFRRSFHNHLLKKVEKLASRIAALGQCLRPHHVSYNYHRNKALYYIGFRKGKISPFSKNNKINFSVPIHRVDVLSQGLLLQHAPPNGLKNKSLYYIGFFRGFLGGCFWKKIKNIFSVPIHRVDVLCQRLLLQQVLPNGLKHKSLYSIGFEKGIFKGC